MTGPIKHLQMRKLKPEKGNELPPSGTGQNRCAVKEQLLRSIQPEAQSVFQLLIGSPLIRWGIVESIYKEKYLWITSLGPNPRMHGRTETRT